MIVTERHTIHTISLSRKTASVICNCGSSMVIYRVIYSKSGTEATETVRF